MSRYEKPLDHGGGGDGGGESLESQPQADRFVLPTRPGSARVQGILYPDNKGPLFLSRWIDVYSLPSNML